MKDVFSVLVIIGILFTFVPQQVRIIKLKSSVGLSPYFMLLGATSISTQLINILLMQIPIIELCKNGSLTCFSDMLGVLQVFVLTLCIFTNCVFFLVYYPKPLHISPEGRHVERAIYLFIIFCVACIIILFGTFVSADANSITVRTVGQIFGIFCTILSCIQYIPQVLKTWFTMEIGALSSATLAIQAPGSFFFAYTIANRPATDFTTWGSFFISGTFQTILVILCTYIKFLEKNCYSMSSSDDNLIEVESNGAADAASIDIPDENTFLLNTNQ